MIKTIVTWLGCLASIAVGAAGMTGVPSPPQIDAAAYVLMDFQTGEVLAEHNADTPLEPASLVKIMSVYVTAAELAKGTINQDDSVLVSEKAWRTEGSKTFIEVDKRVAVHDLLNGVIIQSGNDASVALAEHVSGDESVFASLMNQHAQQLGMKNSHFTNSTGLPDPELHASARDLGMLSAALIREFPDIYALFSQREFVFNGIKQANRNSLLGTDESVDGVKTGHTEGAGYCLVSSAERGPMRLIAVVMGAASTRARASASQALLNYGFRFFETRQLYAGKQPVTTAKVWKGTMDTVAIGLPEALYLTIPRNRFEDLDAVVELDTPLIAPIDAGGVYGRLELKLDGAVLKTIPLQALGPVAAAGFFGRAVDQVRMMFE